MLEMRTAATRIGDDGIELLRRKLVDLIPRQLLGQFPFAVMRMQRATAKLLGRRDNFAPIACKDLHSVVVDVAENKILSTAGQHGHTVLFLTNRRGDNRYEFR